ncbi:MAG: M20/M25/M40 family metallo-hydrolase, partial [Polyangiales bacterium]
MSDDAAAAVIKRINALQHELVDEISKAVRIPSVNPKYPGQVYDEVVGRESEVAQLVTAIHAEAGAETDVFAIEPGRDNAVGVVRGTGGGRSLVYNGHMDVVPEGNPDSWTDDPFSGARKDGRIWGRGASDM